MTVNRMKVNSLEGQLAAVAAAREPLPEPPETLPEEALPIWDSVMAARTRQEWKDHPSHLYLALQLVKTTYRIGIESALLEAEGYVTEDGVRKTNPRALVVQGLVQQQLSLMKALRIVGAAVGGRRSELESARRSELVASRLPGMPGSDDELDDLIAPPWPQPWPACR